MSAKQKDNFATLGDIAKRTGITFEEAQRFIDSILSELCLGREVRLKNLGIFRVSELEPRSFPTPIIPGGTGNVEKRKVIRFERSPNAKDRINGVER